MEQSAIDFEDLENNEKKLASFEFLKHFGFKSISGFSTS